MGSLPVGACLTAIASERRVRESSHGERVDGDGVMPWRDSEQMVREPFHGETARGWRGSHSMM